MVEFHRVETTINWVSKFILMCNSNKISVGSELYYPVDLTSHLVFVKIYLNGSLFLYGFHGQKRPTKLQNLIHTILNNPINKKQTPLTKKLWRSKIGGGGGDVLPAPKNPRFFFFFFFFP